MSKTRVLVVDDEENVRFVVASALKLSGFDVTELRSGSEALDSLTSGNGAIDLVVLDVGLPDIDGFEVCVRLRSAGIDVPIVFLTARDTARDRLHGLTIGGDDYLAKPFSIEELVMRTRIILRRTGKIARPTTLSFDDIVLDEDAHVVRQGGSIVPVSPTEYRLLRFFLQNTGLALSRTQILDSVWDYDFAGESTVVESFVSSLRRKLDPEGTRFHTVRGIGYRMGD
ncbi:response regulator transcription factor [soil metagenome]